MGILVLTHIPVRYKAFSLLLCMKGASE